MHLGHPSPNLATPGHTWPHLATPGHIWPHLATSGHTWPHLATPGHSCSAFISPMYRWWHSQSVSQSVSRHAWGELAHCGELDEIGFPGRKREGEDGMVGGERRNGSDERRRRRRRDNLLSISLLYPIKSFQEALLFLFSHSHTSTTLHFFFL